MLSISILLLGSIPVYAEETIENFSLCEQAITQANTNAQILYLNKASEFFALKKYSGVAKAKNIGRYDRTYTCDTKAICQAIKTSDPEDMLLEGTIGCVAISVEELGIKLETDFKGCQNPPTLFAQEERWNRCDQMRISTLRSSRVNISKSFQHEVALENQGNLGTKILGMQQRMAVFLEKTRLFSYNFVKVLNDISCTLPGKSF